MATAEPPGAFRCVSKRVRLVEHARRQRGFTLVELLLGISLTVLLFISVYGTIRVAANGLHHIEDGVRRLEQSRVTERFLQRQLDHAIADPRRAFHGKPDGMSFAVVPSRGFGPTELCRIDVRRQGNSATLHARMTALNGSGSGRRAVLGSEAGNIALSYFGNPGEESPAWRSYWTFDKLPILVRMTITKQQRRVHRYFAVAGGSGAAIALHR